MTLTGEIQDHYRKCNRASLIVEAPLRFDQRSLFLNDYSILVDHNNLTDLL